MLAVALFHENTKERKGLGTSPFGPSGLTPYPHPLRFYAFLGNSLNATEAVRDGRSRRQVSLRKDFSETCGEPGQQPPAAVKMMT